ARRLSNAPARSRWRNTVQATRGPDIVAQGLSIHALPVPTPTVSAPAAGTAAPLRRPPGTSPTAPAAARSARQFVPTAHSIVSHPGRMRHIDRKLRGKPRIRDADVTKQGRAHDEVFPLGGKPFSSVRGSPVTLRRVRDSVTFTVDA